MKTLLYILSLCLCIALIAVGIFQSNKYLIIGGSILLIIRLSELVIKPGKFNSKDNI